MKVLFMGDVVGRPGLQAVRTLLPRVRAQHGVDVVVANAENSDQGSGITSETAHYLLDSGVQLLTSGNHFYSKKAILPWVKEHPDLLLRPANYPKGTPGKGHSVVKLPDGRALGVINLEGRVFMRTEASPFEVVEGLVEELRQQTPCILVDMHCEASSEKNAMGVHLDGRVSVVVGTHTHVQTADERILPGGTAFITDVGMCGPLDSVIGMKKESSLTRFLGKPAPYEVAERLVYLQGVVVDIDDATGQGRSIHRVREHLPGT
ncbi:conserved hypothetical protein TIGR00282 [Myxococcus xanthus DK 1622]|uniref:Metallophosphoesterase n=1 Tax=Myxococcus xanthus (strain DK1622) TaxID=246197 RepID=Q1D837_MYXXD|nr:MULTISPECIES: TIGR00282 family metallophosphoesterase [Myxococcus]ABF90612.1 conserved hypothetical protein TIGR00282 [Myxococcus xanthus DK 1622]NOJ55206.1 TIGR00282 family metallophosphoesterase [Myxococcus xanthus]QPM82452.1 TIGR00282 family metallophosphoesterase [Myxococcus xanthus]QVW64757.1 TIGR00282 family metallophosphoesterase [Myxococcus xanthus DZ2]UEO02172.1 TIGR00282 family metallophosphoesterase [Myxococcus xanthus DZ2]